MIVVPCHGWYGAGMARYGKKASTKVRETMQSLHLDGLIVDLDGVVWIGSTAVPGSVDALAELRARKTRLLFLTNNPRDSRVDYAARLTALGVPAHADDIVTSGSALASLVGEREGAGTTAFVIGLQVRHSFTFFVDLLGVAE